jgi:hypothetical protein
MADAELCSPRSERPEPANSVANDLTTRLADHRQRDVTTAAILKWR